MAAGNQDWGVRYIGSVGTSKMSIPEQFWRARNLVSPGPSIKGGLFEIKNMTTGESRYFAFSGAGLAISVGGPVQASPGDSRSFTRFTTDAPVTFKDFSGPANLGNVSFGVGVGYAFSQLVFNEDIQIQGRGFWDTIWQGTRGVDVSGPVAGAHLDISSSIGGLTEIPGHGDDVGEQTRPAPLPAQTAGPEPEPWWDQESAPPAPFAGAVPPVGPQSVGTEPSPWWEGEPVSPAPFPGAVPPVGAQERDEPPLPPPFFPGQG